MFVSLDVDVVRVELVHWHLVHVVHQARNGEENRVDGEPVRPAEHVLVDHVLRQLDTRSGNGDAVLGPLHRQLVNVWLVRVPGRDVVDKRAVQHDLHVEKGQVEQPVGLVVLEGRVVARDQLLGQIGQPGTQLELHLRDFLVADDELAVAGNRVQVLDDFVQNKDQVCVLVGDPVGGKLAHLLRQVPGLRDVLVVQPQRHFLVDVLSGDRPRQAQHPVDVDVHLLSLAFFNGLESVLLLAVDDDASLLTFGFIGTWPELGAGVEEPDDVRFGEAAAAVNAGSRGSLCLYTRANFSNPSTELLFLWCSHRSTLCSGYTVVARHISLSSYDTRHRPVSLSYVSAAAGRIVPPIAVGEAAFEAGIVAAAAIVLGLMELYSAAAVDAVWLLETWVAVTNPSVVFNHSPVETLGFVSPVRTGVSHDDKGTLAEQTDEPNRDKSLLQTKVINPRTNTVTDSEGHHVSDDDNDNHSFGVQFVVTIRGVSHGTSSTNDTQPTKNTEADNQ
ncbi:hypothetical protein WICPIJ_001976 [Wickerhamomyces pijperi]|uniref:Uncharacterized protein n=1 Tax=Wickerhamomyces pijperi TaxID=599730 RepID=A0A9P8Q9T6_WICPI|nr:hypothetical protein WICPIJ_001976 [Wickerhamomyces pijperi]